MISSRIQKKIGTMIDKAMSTHNSLDTLRSTTLNGYRGLHSHQIFKYGQSSTANTNNTTFTFGNPGPNNGTQVGP